MSDAEVRAQAFDDAAKEVRDLFDRVLKEHREEYARGIRHTPATYAVWRALLDAPWILQARAREVRRGFVGPGETIRVAYDVAIGWHRVPE